ncbi:MAG TPA: M23 family metallopeptidase [Thermoanaerobaculia bacterium]|nr:M23 family metallopeptidase [Thermoanaerobaculia bacterium]
MGKTVHTIILVPHARARLRKWRVSNTQIAVALGLFAILTLSAATVTFLYFRQSVDSAEIARLRGENRELRQVNTSFEGSLRQLQDRLATYEDRTMDLAIVAGLDPAAAGAEAGIGGGAALEGADLETLEQRAARLDGALDRVAAELDEQMRWISSTPAITPAKGILTSGFGIRRDPITRGRALHQGLDIAAVPGAPVRASAAGVVTLAGRNGGLGKSVTLAHGYGLSTRYGHMSDLAVRAGQRVERGDVIGYVGNTGRSTGYHLHYEVHRNGKPVDPMAYILDRPTSR